MIKIGNLNIENFKLGTTQVEKIFLGTTQVWALPSVGNCLTFTAEQANSTISYTPSSVTTAKYSTDGNTWYSFDNQTVTLSNIGDTIFVVGSITGDHSSSDYAQFSMTGQISASGSIMSLYNNDPDEKTIEFLEPFFKQEYLNISLLKFLGEANETVEKPKTYVISASEKDSIEVGSKKANKPVTSGVIDIVIEFQ